MITQTYNLNMVPDYGSVPVVVKASQYDKGDRILHFVILDGDTLYEIPQVADVQIQGTKPDSHGFAYGMEDMTEDGRHIVSYSGSRVTVICQEQMTAVPGTVRAEIRIITSSGDVGSANFVMKVERGGLSTDTDISETEIPAIIALARHEMEMAQAAAEAAEASSGAAAASEQAAATSALVAESAAENAKDKAAVAAGEADKATASANDSMGFAIEAEESAEESAQYALESKNHSEDAEAWAVGERGGIEVDSEDETYRNNAKFYAVRSGQFAVESEQSAVDARKTLDELGERIEDAIGGSAMSAWIDFGTGQLMWEGGERFYFYIDSETGNLLWEVAA